MMPTLEPLDYGRNIHTRTEANVAISMFVPGKYRTFFNTELAENTANSSKVSKGLGIAFLTLTKLFRS